MADDCTLTARQREIALMLVGGASLGEISCRMCVSRKGVREYITRINRRLGTRSQAQIVVAMLVRGWVSIEAAAADLEPRMRAAKAADTW